MGDELVLVESRECDVHLHLKCACGLLSFPSSEGPINSRMALATQMPNMIPHPQPLINMSSLPLVSE